jgi:ribA/ribD-fused uncharacterized protein
MDFTKFNNMDMAIRTYSISDCIAFRKTKEVFGGLSNMAAGYSLYINDIIVPTSEHLYQACRFPENPDLQWAIINEKSPMRAKWIGRANIKFTRNDWEHVQFKIMQWVLEVKLSQNWNSFSNLLLSTGTKNIVELTNTPKIWGAVKHNGYYEGINALGRLLMQLRETFARNNNRNYCVDPLDIPNFKFLGASIGLVCDDNYEVDIEIKKQRELISI